MESKELNAHVLEVEKVVKEIDSNIDSGLTENEVEIRLEKFGLNELIQTKKVSAMEIFIGQFKDFLVYLLFFAIGVSLAVGFYELSRGHKPTEFMDALVIFIILIVNAVLGFYQEFKAEKAVESLKKMAPRNAKVKRGGKIKEISVSHVVPGDIIKLDEGDKIPADARLTKAYSMYVDEAILTGESQPVEKDLKLYEEKTMLADRKNMVYSNTIITRGNGEAIVVRTGMKTEVGKIAEKIQEEEPEKSPFQKEVDRFGKLLGIIIMIICAVVFIFELIVILATEGVVFTDEEINEIVEALALAISLAVSAVPEGLIVVITVVMSIGMRKMAERNALVKTLTAVETLGRVNIICSDKTGTLTKNEMTVKKVFLGGIEYDVEGVGYALQGKMTNNSGEIVKYEGDNYLTKYLEVCQLCNNSIVALKENDPINTDVIGDPTEISLMVLAQKMGLNPRAEKLDEIPFNSDRKMMSVVVKINGEIFSLIKGAPDVLMKNAEKALYDGTIKPFSEVQDKYIAKNTEYGTGALRVLGLAYKPLRENYQKEEIEKDYIYLGLAGIIDPARDEVKDSIQEARMAGIRTIMITGDHKITAIAIAKEIGLTDREDAISGAEMEQMSEEELIQRVEKVDVFARVTSEHKLRILKALKSQDYVVSMTGDGVNDAPAVKGANVGVAMGIKGTEVTQEAADMILLDDDYSTIVNAIEEGRGIFETTKSFFRYMLSANFDEIVMVLVAFILMKIAANTFLAIPLQPIQILWLNIATDGIPAMVLGLTPTDPDVMKFKPRKGFNMIHDIKKMIIYAAVIASVLDVMLYVITWSVLMPMFTDPTSILFDPRLVANEAKQIATAQTIVFTSVVFFELFFVFACTSSYRPFWEFRNKHLFWATGLSFTLHICVLFIPGLNDAFHAVPLDRWFYWVPVFLGSSIWILPAEEIRKYIARRKMHKSEAFQNSLVSYHRTN
ncbi:MAG: cation-translocating P-type ATPase [Candidatus Lokiarchaeota archaeon]|nr:cation-translocating P-type ATPase [Candidatus Lokiarchaeota archaeon]